MPEKIPSDCRSFLERTLIRDHLKRPYADRLLAHRFVAEEGPASPAETAVASP